MQIRPAREEDVPWIEEAIRANDGELIDVRRAVVFVAEENGEGMGIICARMVWQIEPLIVRTDVPKVKASRAALLLYRAMEAWLKGSANLSGVRWFFTITRSEAVKGWANRLGWFRIYGGANIYVKHLKEATHGE